MSGVFISYRREDTSYIAGRLHDRLAAHFGDDHVFRDVDTIDLGVDFAQRIDEAVGSCQALVAVIGNDWLTVKDAKGRRRVDNPRDWVRLEIAAALKRNILVVPVLVEGMGMPAPADLPPGLRRLARLQALELTDVGWNYQVQQLINVLEGVVPTRTAGRRAGSGAGAPPLSTVGVRARPSRGLLDRPAGQPAGRRPEPPAATADNAPDSPPSAPAPPRPTVQPAPPPPPAVQPSRPSVPPPAAGPTSVPGGGARRTGVPAWLKFAIPAFVTVLAAVALVGVLASSPEPSGQAGSGTTVVPPPADDPERPFPFAYGSESTVDIGGQTFTRTELDGITSTSTVALEQPLVFGREPALSRRARAQLQYVVNRLGPPRKGVLDFIEVGPPSWDGNARALRVTAFLRNGFTRSATDVKLDSSVYCRDHPDAATAQEKVVAQGHHEFMALDNWPIIPPAGTLAVELRFSGSDIKDPGLDLARYRYCRYEV